MQNYRWIDATHHYCNDLLLRQETKKKFNVLKDDK